MFRSDMRQRTVLHLENGSLINGKRIGWEN